MGVESVFNSFGTMSASIVAESVVDAAKCSSYICTVVQVQVHMHCSTSTGTGTYAL